LSHAFAIAATAAGFALVTGCGAPRPPAEPPADLPETTTSDWPFRTSTQLGHEPGAFVAIGATRRPRPAVVASAAPPAPPSPAAQLLPEITGGTYDRTYGAALDGAIAALPEDRRALGVHGVEGADLAELCEAPHVLLSGDGYEASLTVPGASWFEGSLERAREALPEDCAASLLASAGDVAAAACAEEDERAHFPVGSDCRTCLEADGDHARCVAEAQCPELATRQVEVGGGWYTVLRAPGPICAPDHVGDLLFLAFELAEDEPLPQPFDHGALEGSCVEAWAGDGLDLYCTMGLYNAIGDVVYSRVDYIRPEGDTSTPWAYRVSLVRSIEVEGRTFTGAWLGQSGVTAVSAPIGSVPDAWGINPTALRPDGTDPTNPDHTYARDYVAAFSLKIASERNGVLVNPVNRNRCADDAWEGPHADGTYSCDEPGAWSTDGWYDDALVAWWDQAAGEIYDFPLVTLASTGLPDPDVPGGLLTEVLGSTTLADAEWEACAWPKTFVPDRVRLYDPAPATSSEGYASFDGQTYRLGRDPSTDVRLFLATNQRREFCPPFPD
jgi:hypothetical protein